MPPLAIWFIGILASAFFGPDILRKYSTFFGAPVPTNEADILPLLQKMTSSASGYTPTSPSTPGAVPEPNQDPTPSQILANAVDKPINWLFIALLLFAAVFFIAQVRAAAHEATETTKDVLNEAKAATNTLANADGTTRNISRRMKK